MSASRTLKLDNVHAFYGKSHVLHGVSMQVNPGEIVSLLGRNGAGRSTMVKTIMGSRLWTNGCCNCRRPSFQILRSCFKGWRGPKTATAVQRPQLRCRYQSFEPATALSM